MYLPQISQRDKNVKDQQYLKQSQKRIKAGLAKAK